jgi:hypothetical protein
VTGAEVVSICAVSEVIDPALLDLRASDDIADGETCDDSVVEETASPEEWELTAEDEALLNQEPEHSSEGWARIATCGCTVIARWRY